MESLFLIYGGPGGEHRVSQVSALGIYRHLDRTLWNPILVGVGLNREWYLQDAPTEAAEMMPIEASEERLVWAVPGRGLATGAGLLGASVAFVLIHGSHGEDGRIQGLLDWAGVRYVGSGVMGSALGMDKDLVKRVWRDAGLPVVDWRVLRRGETRAHWKTVIADAVKAWGWPLFVKPANSGSSVGVSRVDKGEDLEKALQAAFEVDAKVLLEPALSIREVECAVLELGGTTRAFPPGEVLPTHTFYDYDAKYIDPNGAKLRIPADLEPEVFERVRETAVRAFLSSEARGFARVDFFLEKNGPGLWLNEINTLPGFTPISMYPKMCEAGGVGYTDLISLLLEGAV